MSFSESNLQEAVRQGVTQMKARREAEQQLAEFARDDPETVAKEMLTFARTERDRLRQELAEHFGFSVSREHSGFRFRLASPERRPRTPGKAAAWVDRVVALVGFEVALDGMRLAAAYFR